MNKIKNKRTNLFTTLRPLPLGEGVKSISKRLTNTWVRAGILAFLLIFSLAVSANAGTMTVNTTLEGNTSDAYMKVQVADAAVIDVGCGT
ncbi:MAG: hypothetical protein WCT39_00835 [Candidatus Margulisiibacteriota bacterium]|jgi:hypothetical protein